MFSLFNVEDYLDTYSYVCHSLVTVVCLIRHITQYTRLRNPKCVFSLSCLYKNNERNRKRK